MTVRAAPRPAPEELALVGEAVSALRRGLGPHRHPSASAARTSDGVVVSALTLRDDVGTSVCSEAAVVAAVVALGKRVAVLATVRHLDEDATRVTAPCPTCRALLQVHAPAVKVLHLADGLRVSRVPDLP